MLSLQVPRETNTKCPYFAAVIFIFLNIHRLKRLLYMYINSFSQNHTLPNMYSLTPVYTQISTHVHLSIKYLT